jgi:hypothetical protein
MLLDKLFTMVDEYGIENIKLDFLQLLVKFAFKMASDVK